MFNIDDYNYHLPEELIAQVPEQNRDKSRLLFIDRKKKILLDHYFFDLPRLLRPGDLVVINNTRVVPSKLFGHKQSGGKIEILVLDHSSSEHPDSDTRWCLLKSSKRPGKGSVLFFEKGYSARVEDICDDGRVRLTFEGVHSVEHLLKKEGYMPLPPYIKRERSDIRSAMDRERYQTIFACERGAVAAPTAGLHFTDNLIEELNRSDISLIGITLHVGHGTFQPVRTNDIRKHNLGEEKFEISLTAEEVINSAKKDGRRIIAVGTTVVRTLESIASEAGKIMNGKGKTSLLITPGFPFKVIDGLITNFHLPRSSLLFLVSAFAGINFIKKAYQRAIDKKYRFYSYGDAMLIL